MYCILSVLRIENILLVQHFATGFIAFTTVIYSFAKLAKIDALIKITIIMKAAYQVVH